MSAIGVIELRQYTLLPGRRDELIDLFDRHFVSGQRDAGITVIGQFRDLDDQDRFVWLRGFESVQTRATALAGFYYGPVWQRFREQANATMIDSGNVLLLTPHYLPPELADSGVGPVADSPEGIGVTVWSLDGIDPSAYPNHAADLLQNLQSANVDIVAILTTALVDNDFPALPLRDDRVLVAVTRGQQEGPIFGKLVSPVLQRLRLSPTDASRLR